MNSNDKVIAESDANEQTDVTGEVSQSSEI